MEDTAKPAPLTLNGHSGEIPESTVTIYDDCKNRSGSWEANYTFTVSWQPLSLHALGDNRKEAFQNLDEQADQFIMQLQMLKADLAHIIESEPDYEQVYDYTEQDLVWRPKST